MTTRTTLPPYRYLHPEFHAALQRCDPETFNSRDYRLLAPLSRKDATWLGFRTKRDMRDLHRAARLIGYEGELLMNLAEKEALR